ncbi:MDM12 [[Candida] subhashii]|uniref:1-phosphatidylinositol-3-phosphate 5-kinase n=1 Tax=[Candida] subhashii TaxID=561895 RepID=A0A8J5USY8_9ASCO|nr:MDM12 [[Candida] subhashii]KAG7665522.1 MDM12 [[Candida] subhashii]
MATTTSDPIQQQEQQRYPSYTNNSDEESDTDTQDQEQQQSNSDDFVSFPTIPDPELNNSKSISGLLSETLRKVTANASHLVSNYSQNYVTSPKSVYTEAHPENYKLKDSPKQDTVEEEDEHTTTQIVRVPGDIGSAIPITNVTSATVSATTNTAGTTNSSVVGLGIASGPTVLGKESRSKMHSPEMRMPSPVESKDLSKIASSPTVSSRFGSSTPPVPLHSSEERDKLPPHMNIRQTKAEDTPRVTSDNKTLRISTMHFPRIQSVNNSATSSVHNIHAVAAAGANEVESIDGDRRVNVDTDSKKPSKKAEATNNRTLQSRISSIFNNLPNDIELSDDSASDAESTMSVNISHRNHFTLENPSSTNISMRGNYLPYDISSMYSESIAKSSPIKAERRIASSILSDSGQSPTVSSFHALQSKDQVNAIKKRPTSNLSAVLLDNAKTIITNNIGVVASSASSIYSGRTREKKPKRKPKKTSENPLKSGGIPKKYWMNDAFVSDCLNCLRPFTAFRRKHHCRFCGQIFCADCTLFISYNQHKDERNNSNPRGAHKRPYNDKLRVCKPCYSDVIIYLSDDSSCSEDEHAIVDEEAIEDVVDTTKGKHGEELIVPNHPLSRIRSLSTTSYRDSVMNEPGTILANKAGALKNEGSNATLSSNSNSPSRGNNGNVNHNNNINSQFTYPDESIKVHPKQAPRMAIPTTRTGESVEIPLMRSNLSGSNLKTSSSGYGSSLKVSTLTPTTPHHYHTPQSSTSNDVNKNWRMNYSHLSPISHHRPELVTSRSLDNISGATNTFVARKVSLKKFRVQSGSGTDLRRHMSRKEGSVEPGDMPHPGHFEGIYSDADDDDYDDDEYEDEDEGYDDDEDGIDAHGGGISDNEEDEHAMSLYASLNLPYPTTPKPPVHTNTSVTVPTLGEFPSMISGNFRTSSNFGRMFPSNSVAFVEEYPRKESLRSKERAHASLQRIRSRRQSKGVRNVSKNNRFPSFEKHNGSFLMTVPSSPASPGHNNNHKNGIHSNSNTLTKTITNDHSASEFVSTSSVNLISDVSASAIDDTTSTAIPSQDFLSSEEHLSQDHTWNEHERNHEVRNKVYADLLETVLRQSLEDCDIKEHQDRWVKALQKSLECINFIRITDTLDVKQYIKIKKILGGKIEETSVIDGLFMTKNIDSKRMSFEIDSPRIALLMFPVEYLKQKEQFISLRIIHAQQSVYISNLVSRLISLEPDIIVVGDSVCGLAEQLLEESGITVMSNVKPQVIERISRYCKADIFQSVNDLFFKKGKLGTCERFEIKRYKFDNIIKTFAFFTGSELANGFTICLRGGDEELLNSIKYAAETLISGYLNSRFEKSYFDNLLVSFDKELTNSKVVEINRKLQEINNPEDDDDKEEESKSCELSLDSTEVVNYVKLFNERKLSLSPISMFTLPTPLVNVIDSYYNFHGYFKRNKVIQNLESVEGIDDSWLDELRVNLDISALPNKQDDLLRILQFASDIHLKGLINEYNSRARIWSNCMRYNSYQLYPIFHRNIHVLHSTVSIKHATPCTGPSIVVIDYYTDNDKCLGLFLDQTFQESTKKCTDCEEPIIDHYKSYVHGNAKIDLILEKFDIATNSNYQGKNQRVMWSYCKVCNYATPIIVMNDETYYLSIGKFFEIWFYGENIHGGCEHDFTTNYVRCFAFNDLVIRMEYSMIDNYEIMVPKKQLEFIPDIDVKLKLDAYNNIQSKTIHFFESISKRLNRVKLDTFEKAEDGMKRIKELKDNLEQQKSQLVEKLQNIYNSTVPTNYVGLNVILRDLQKLGVIWDNEFNEFEKKFLPSENEITRITQFHLRNFLMDKYKEDDEAINNNEENKEVEMVDMSSHRKSNVQEESNKSESSSKSVAENSETAPLLELPKTIPLDRRFSDSNIETKMFSNNTLYHQGSNISERISKWQQTVEENTKREQQPQPTALINVSSSTVPVLGRRVSSTSSRTSENSVHSNPNPATTTSQPVGTTNTVIPSQNKVIHLANYFDKIYYDQISLEFSKQRQRELKKKPKVKAQPIFESKPIVEIYNKIEDVVGAGLDEDKNKLNRHQVIDSKRSSDEEPREMNIPTTQPPAQQAIEISQPEKQSLLKSLTNFWADRSATLWDPLAYALEDHEHTFADSDVIVREDEPSSLVSFCLSSNDYKSKIQTALELNDDIVGSGGDGGDGEKFNEQLDSSQRKKMNQFYKIEKKFKKNINDFNRLNILENVLTKNKSNHLKYQFIDGNTNLSCKIFYSEQFEALRRTCGNNDNFIQSLSRCIKWQSSGGKSGSNFLKTLDNRYIVKELSKSELESFVSIAPFYFKYISQAIYNSLTTAIAKIFGFYQVQIKNTTTGKLFKMDFLIMENLFYNHKTTRIFDLKGSMRNRHVQQTGKENEVLLDENMIEYIYESPVFVKEQSKKLLRGCLFNDTSFLSAMDVMDYSLVIGIDDSSKKLYIGIIDWLRTFTWDKKVENWVKGNNLIGGNKRGKDPTIVTPKQYRARFREAMERYILEVPDIWYEGPK